MLSTADVILTAAQSAFRLGGQIQQALIDKTKAAPFALPLPLGLNDKPDLLSARNFFTGLLYGEHTPPALLQLVEGNPLVMRLMEEASSSFTEADRNTLMELYDEARRVEAALLSQDAALRVLTPAELSAFVMVRQWGQGQRASPLKRIAGTLIETAVDIFAHTPGLLNENSPQGKALRSFLHAIDDVQFSSLPLGDVAGQLLAATAQVVSENAGWLSNDTRIQQMIGATGKEIALNTATWLNEVRLDSTANFYEKEKRSERLKQAGQMVLKSTLRAAGNTVISNPAAFTGVQGAAQSELVAQVGGTLLDVLLNQKADDIFTTDSLEKLARSALGVAGRHPTLLGTGNNGLQLLLSQVASELSAYPEAFGKEMLPNVAGIILDKTAGNLNRLWPGDTSKAGSHLLLIATRQSMNVLSSQLKNPDIQSLGIGKEQITQLLENILAEVALNPAWIVNRAGEVSPLLGEVLQVSMSVVSRHAGRALNADTVSQLVREMLKQVGLRRVLADKLPGEERMLVEVATDALLGLVLGDKVSDDVYWMFSRPENILQLVQVFMEQLGTIGATRSNADRILLSLQNELKRLDEAKLPLEMPGLVANIRTIKAA